MNAKLSVGGYTLIELLVVLALIGFLTAMVAPNLQRLTNGATYSTQHDALIADITGLSYRAFANGHGMVLANDTFGALQSDGNPLLAVPEGWRVAVKEPIQFTFNGFCSGGVITITAPDLVIENLYLEPPACRVHSDA
ncbi:MAG: type II secretion system protein [Burkholderiaceae bacterium]|nr:type II secretion system protein [Burkholderiaceae bacterium]